MATSTIPKRALTNSFTLYSTSSPIEQNGTDYLQLADRLNSYPICQMIIYIDSISTSRRCVISFFPGSIGTTPWYAAGCSDGSGAIRLAVNGSTTDQFKILEHTFTKVYISAIYGLY